MAEVDILDQLTNAELRSKCQQYKLPNVPVTDHSRKVLIRRLRAVMKNIPCNSPNSARKSFNCRDIMPASNRSISAGGLPDEIIDAKSRNSICSIPNDQYTKTSLGSTINTHCNIKKQAQQTNKHPLEVSRSFTNNVNPIIALNQNQYKQFNKSSGMEHTSIKPSCGFDLKRSILPLPEYVSPPRNTSMPTTTSEFNKDTSPSLYPGLDTFKNTHRQPPPYQRLSSLSKSGVVTTSYTQEKSLSPSPKVVSYYEPHKVSSGIGLKESEPLLAKEIYQTKASCSKYKNIYRLNSKLYSDEREDNEKEWNLGREEEEVSNSESSLSTDSDEMHKISGRRKKVFSSKNYSDMSLGQFVGIMDQRYHLKQTFAMVACFMLAVLIYAFYLQ